MYSLRRILLITVRCSLGILLLLPLSATGETQRTDFPTMKKYAEKGVVRAQLIVGLTYYFGKYRDGTPVGVDCEQALLWLRKAAEGGDSYAPWHLGGMYREGKRVEFNDKEAARWFLEAAKSGNVKARTNIAFCYYEGTGVEKDFDKAYAWASLAAYRGNANAKALVGKLIPELEDRKRADSLAVEYFKKYGATDPYE
jgi:TPR repeat protein